MSFCQGFNSFSARRRRTASRDKSPCSVNLTISPATESNVHRARPQASLNRLWPPAAPLPAVSLRAVAGRASPASASTRLPTTKRPLVRYKVDSLTRTLATKASSPTPASALRKRSAQKSADPKSRFGQHVAREPAAARPSGCAAFSDRISQCPCELYARFYRSILRRFTSDGLLDDRVPGGCSLPKLKPPCN